MSTLNNNIISNFKSEFENSVKEFINFNELTTLVKSKISHSIERLCDFIFNEFEQFFSLQHLKLILKRFGFKKQIKIYGDIFLQQVQLASLKLLLQSKGFYFKDLEPEIDKGNYVTMLASGVKSTNVKKYYQSGIYEIDQYFRYSVIANKICEDLDFESLNNIKKFQLKYLLDYLVNQSEYTRQRLESYKHSQVFNGSKNIFCDYLQELINNNGILSRKIDFSYKPILIELNGKAGVGKTMIINSFNNLCKFLFPFISHNDIVYNRVNDKFWNGYKQQPIVLFDDSNQNKKLLYDLDNEIIQIGSGLKFYLPMAFEKDTRFNSCFVFFTTNKTLLSTTQADKGAIRRRITTYKVKPLQIFGRYVGSRRNKHWIYNPDVIFSPFNVTFNSNCTYIDLIMNGLSNITGERLGELYSFHNITLENILDFYTKREYSSTVVDLVKESEYYKLKGHMQVAKLTEKPWVKDVKESVVSLNQLNVIMRNYFSSKISFI